jgi:biotin transport system substrate-specific component
VLVALVCTPGQAAVALGLYLALGAAGAPVFSGAQGGIAVLVGPTGGYLIGFALGAIAGAAVRRLLPGPAPARDAAAAVTVLIVVYAIGAVRLASVTGSGLPAAVAGGVAPFVLFDAAKAAGAVAVAAALRRAGFADTPPGTGRV